MKPLNTSTLVKVVLLLIALLLLISGHTDLDWMLVTNHFQFGYGGAPVWEFCPYLIVDWWIAFKLTELRIAIGWLIIGWLLRNLIKTTADDRSETDSKKEGI